MQLLFTTDLTIKALTYMAFRGEVVTLHELGQVFDVNYTSFKRQFRILIELGTVSAVRGRHGGFHLSKDAADIYLGELIHHLESDMYVVPAMRPDDQGAVRFADSVYRFTAVHATRAFLTKFDSLTIADLVADKTTLELFGITPNST